MEKTFLMFKYLLATGVTLLASIGLLKPHFGKRKQAKCLKCEDGIGYEFQRGSGKVSFKCDKCGSIWVSRQ